MSNSSYSRLSQPLSISMSSIRSLNLRASKPTNLRGWYATSAFTTTHICAMNNQDGPDRMTRMSEKSTVAGSRSSKTLLKGWFNQFCSFMNDPKSTYQRSSSLTSPNCWCFPLSTMWMTSIYSNITKTRSFFRIPPWHHKWLAINRIPVYRDGRAWTKKSGHSNCDAWKPTWTCICSDVAGAMTTCSILMESAVNAI